MADGGLPDEHGLLLVQSLRFQAVDDDWDEQLKKILIIHLVSELINTFQFVSPVSIF